jgi:hypothetical protein
LLVSRSSQLSLHPSRHRLIEDAVFLARRMIHWSIARILRPAQVNDLNGPSEMKIDALPRQGARRQVAAPMARVGGAGGPYDIEGACGDPINHKGERNTNTSPQEERATRFYACR